MNHLLMPLRIPSGWAVTYNVYFAEVPMEVHDGRIVNFEYFKEDLLTIRQLTVSDGHHEVDRAGWLLDLGWYPDADPGGAYTLTLVRGQWTDGVVLRVRARDAQTIRSAIERALDGLLRGEDIVSLHDAIGASWADGIS
jgi:hypothetical protein